jgi:hypothetical protein
MARNSSPLCYYIDASIGFTALAEAPHIPPKSLMRMFSKAGKRLPANLFEAVNFLQHHEGVRFHIGQASS